MKKILFIAMIIGSFATQTKAQVGQIRFSGSDATTDTITNAGTVYLTSEDLTGKGYTSFAVQIPFTNISGTSTFKVISQCTLDGTNWTNLHAVPGTNGILCDTLQVTSGAPANWIFRAQPRSVTSASSSTFYYTNAGYCKKIRFAHVGAGSQSTRVGPATGVGIK